ncbi:cbb3-type cytochrome c oxidase N-terminal domain-containing protein [Rubrolithibacter danxiaensis]|uniref:cbb3-type cytochrome c oxidase N-terminal domain-containing protein n=1 Tax=Rubrolithibacter danxiaensis TaxID=3390805 RepID=UPI003BF7A561
MKKIFQLSILLASAFPVMAEEKAPGAESGGSLLNLTVIVFILAALVLLVVAIVLLRTFKTLSAEILNPTSLPVAEPERRMEWDEWAALQKNKPGIWSRLLGLKPIEEEKDILLEHQFDGISELDNPTPAWFMGLFYVTIIFGIGYLITYHGTGWGKNQEQEYVAEMKQAKIEKEAYLSKSSNNIDENSVKESKEAAALSAGEGIFKANCVACHGDKAQGVVGPNLTDEYWLHGGKINDVFKTIKYGIPEKGMISWEKTLSPKQISDVANYIGSLKGTNPPNPKAPQGDKEG